MVPTKITWAPLRKLLPLTEIVKFPTGIGMGRAADTTGILLNSVIAEGALWSGDPSTLVALTAQACDFGNSAGAV